MNKSQIKASKPNKSAIKPVKKVSKQRSPIKTTRRHNSKSAQTQTQQNVPTTHGIANQGKPLRVAHLTDLHYFSKQPPTLSQLLSKRIAGYANLVLFKRRRHFSDEARHNTIAKIDEMQPDIIICSGDLSSTGLDAEFDEAYQSLKPLTQKYPFFLIPGNHDVYVKENETQLSLPQRFSNYMHTIFPTKLKTLKSSAPAGRESSTDAKHAVTQELGEKGIWSTTSDNLVSPQLQQQFPTLSFFLSKNKKNQGNETYSMIIGLNPCRADNFSSTGEYPAEQLKQLAELLNQDESSSLLFVDGKTQKKIKPFVILVTHYPVIDRSGADYTMAHSNHGATNNHQLLSVLDNAYIKPGLILHGHDHLGAATGIVTQRMIQKQPIDTTLSAPKPPKVKTHVPLIGGGILANVAPSPDSYEWKFDPTTHMPITPWDIPTVKDITHAYSNTYAPETIQQLQKHLVENLAEQHGADRARETIRINSFKQLDLVSGLSYAQSRFTLSNQHGSFFHTSAPLKLKDYLAGKMKPFGVSTHVPKKYIKSEPQFYDEASKSAHADRIKKKEKMLNDYYAKNPSLKNPHVDVIEEAVDLARREERETCIVDVTKQTEMSPNLITDVVIPIHNPGSGALSGMRLDDSEGWPKFASFNMYTLTARPTPLPKSKESGQGYVTSDYFTLGVQHCIQEEDLKFPKVANEATTPYTFPLRFF